MTVKHDLKFSDKLEDNVEYMIKCTSSWNLEDSEGVVCLYHYHDGVDWKHHYAIAVNGVVKSLLKDNCYTEAYKTFKTVVDCLS